MARLFGNGDNRNRYRETAQCIIRTRFRRLRGRARSASAPGCAPPTAERPSTANAEWAGESRWCSSGIWLIKQEGRPWLKTGGQARPSRMRRPFLLRRQLGDYNKPSPECRRPPRGGGDSARIESLDGLGYQLPTARPSSYRLPTPASGRDDLSGCRNAEYLLVLRQLLDKVLHVRHLTLTVQFDCFLARPACQAGDAVKLID